MAAFLLLTRRLNISLVLYTLIFFPGVFLHEISHWLMAGMLRVPTGKIKLIPEWTPTGQLRMGSVEAARTDIVRDSLIGAAPMLFGGLVVAWIGYIQLGLDELWALMAQDPAAFTQGLGAVYAQKDFWLWFYLLFVVSSTMLPSASDRYAWRPLILTVAMLLGLALFAGAGPWMLANLAPLVNSTLRAVAAVFGISLVVHAALLIPVYLFRRLLNHLTGLRVA